MHSQLAWLRHKRVQRVRQDSVDTSLRRVFRNLSLSTSLFQLSSFVVTITLGLWSPIPNPKLCEKLCLHRGSCQNTTCLCPIRWTGNYCGYDVDKCQNDKNLCLNGGTWANIVGSYECLCTRSFVDYQCNNSVNDCYVYISLCLNSGRWVNSTSEWTLPVSGHYLWVDSISEWTLYQWVDTTSKWALSVNGYYQWVDTTSKWTLPVVVIVYVDWIPVAVIVQHCCD